MTKHRILTNPVRLTGTLHPQQLSSLVAIDAVARRRLAVGGESPTWGISTLSGDVAVQRAVERVVAREGVDPDAIGREGFAARAKRLETQASAGLAQLLAEVGVNADLDSWSADSEVATRNARVAFVRLYEMGALAASNEVLDSCPSCETVVGDADADDVEVEVEQIRMSLPLVEGHLEIDVIEPELLVGAVAVAVPADAAPPDTTVELPFVENEVPIVAVVDLPAPLIVVPGHNRWSHGLARQMGYPIIEVLDAEGVVRHPSVFEGLGRYAARAAATEQLAAEGYLIARGSGVQAVKRCYRCGTHLVPLLGRHWILSMNDLGAPVAEMVRAGEIAFSPPSGADELIQAAERGGSWCVSQQLRSGHPIPVSTCLDCGQTTVSVDDVESCGSCMGTLVAHPDVLDARFIAAVTPLAMMGWPNNLEPAGSVPTTLSVGRVGVEAWALPMAALGLRLAGVVPYSQVILHHLAVGVTELGVQNIDQLLAMVDAVGAPTVRVAMLTGDLDMDRARETIELLANPPIGDDDLSGIIEAYDKAMMLLDAGGALALLVNAVSSGVRLEAHDLVHELAQPLLGT